MMNMNDLEDLPVLHGRAIILLEDDDLQDAIAGMKSSDHVVSAQVSRVIETVPARPVDGVYIKRRRLIWLFVAGVLFLVVIILGISFGLSVDSSQQLEPVSSSSFSLPATIEKFATSLPDYTQSALQKELLNANYSGAYWFMYDEWDNEHEFSPQSPQGKAWKWLVSDKGLSSRSLSDITLRFALATFYYATNGPNWKNNTNWLTSEDVCSWFCVSQNTQIPHSYSDYLDYCQRSGFSQLLLSDNGLIGSIPLELALLTDLNVVKVGSNALYGDISDILWASWSGARALEFQFNYNLTGTLPSVIGEFSNLMFLNIQANRFYGTLPSQIGRLSALWLFTAPQNEFTGSIPREIGRMKSLQSFVVAENALTSSIPTSIGRLFNMYAFDVGMNQLTGSIPFQIEDCMNLLSFRVLSNALTGSIPVTASRLTRLQALLLNNNTLMGSLPSELGGLESLFDLDVSSNAQITGTLPSELDQLAKLTNLRVFDTNISGSVPSGVCNAFLAQNVVSNILIDCDQVDCDCNCTCG
ncbi:hypothetical protein MPSEU_000749600 [Mayamaea pseudoterrestris]|nr:hypothetical protein MPSEU_000749600 [Mayamaea pseudoterrestris]